MTRLIQNVFAAEPPQQGRQGAHRMGPVKLNGADHARWLRTVEVFNEQGEVAATETVSGARGSASRRSARGPCLDRPGAPGKDAPVRCLLSGAGTLETPGTGPFLPAAVDDDPADVPWSRVAALLAINRLRASSRTRPSWNGTSRSVLQAELARMLSLAPMKRARPRPGTRCRA